MEKQNFPSFLFSNPESWTKFSNDGLNLGRKKWPKKKTFSFFRRKTLNGIGIQKLNETKCNADIIFIIISFII